MKNSIYIYGLVALTVSFSVNADSFLRVKCYGDDVGAKVYISGKFVGDCPVDVPVNEGSVELRARKLVDADHEQLFSKQLQIIDGVLQKIELIMSAPQLTAEAIRRNQEVLIQKNVALANSELIRAKSGDIYAMNVVAGYYEVGLGVERDSVKAKMWRDKAETATANKQLSDAEKGDYLAMAQVAHRYESGLVFKKDIEQARKWSEKSEVAKKEAEAIEREKVATEKAHIKAQKLEKFSFFEMTKTFGTNNLSTENIHNPLDFSSSIISIPMAIVGGVMSDLSTSPVKTTEYQNIQSEASLRPATWGKPDSMIARASQQYNLSKGNAKNELVAMASK